VSTAAASVAAAQPEQREVGPRGAQPADGVNMARPATRSYVERRTAQGLSKKEIMRCLKRYVAREVYPHLRHAAG
jgi:hypothetical protein